MSKKENKNQPVKNVQPKKTADEKPLLDRVPWLEYVIVGITILALFFIRRNFIGIAFERDEGDYAMFGKWLLTGAKPYVDFYEMKPPGIFLSYALIVKLFGYEYTSLQLGFCYINALTLLFSYLFIKKFIGRIISLAILPVLGFLLLNPHVSGFTIQSEFLVLLFVMVGLYFLFLGNEKKNYLLIVLAGIFLGFSVLIKQAGVFFCFFGGLLFLLDWWKTRKVKKLIFEISAYVIGGIIPVIAVVFWLQLRGVTKEAFFWIVEFPGKYYLSNQSFDAGMDLLQMFGKNIIVFQSFFWFMAFVGLVCGWFLKMPKEKKILLYSFIFLSSLTIVPGLRFMTHYWILFMPGIAISIALTYKFLEQITQKIKFLQTVLTIVFVIVPLAHLLSADSYYLRPVFDDILHNAYGSNPFPEAKVVGDYLKQNMKEGDQLFIAGSEPQIYLYANTLGISRHNFINFINAKTPFAKQWQDEVIHDVETKKPRYLVFVRHPFSWMLDKEGEMTFFQWTQKYIPEYYDWVLVADQVDTRGNCNYVYFKDNPNYQFAGQQFISVFERKEGK
ncbi:hypothetical protein LBMAG27_05710 [Bacteroidota bacterium]|nr:hypothetical protein LBMAG27_05710 [Bacteroidota bacterium]